MDEKKVYLKKRKSKNLPVSLTIILFHIYKEKNVIVNLKNKLQETTGLCHTLNILLFVYNNPD